MTKRRVRNPTVRSGMKLNVECACGCGETIEVIPRRYYSGACRTRAYREREGNADHSQRETK